MLKRVEISGFRCFRKISAPLAPLTVLIGPNDTGKSAFLAALVKLLGSEGFEQTDWYRTAPDGKILIHALTDLGTVTNDSTQGLGKLPEGERLQPVWLYRLPSTGIEMTSQGYPDSGLPPDIGENGQMLPALIDFLLRRDWSRLEQLWKEFSHLVPGVEVVQIGTPNAQLRQIDFVIENGLRIPAAKCSVGVRMLLFFVALAFHPNPPATILVEEPENGVHPKRMREIVGLLRNLTMGKYSGKPSQVILSTHSPYLLDCVDLATDQVLVFKREYDGSRTCQPADAERLKLFLDEFMLGEIWYTQGEEGLVAKKP